VELLVVIGIIALLIALLLPTLNVARQHANTIKCAANLRSIGQALTMYVQQYDHYPAAQAVGRAHTFAIWPTRLRTFLGGDTGAFYCPAQEQRCEWKKFDIGTGPVAGDVESRFGYELGERVLVLNNPSVKTFFSYGYNGMGSSGAVGWIRDTSRGFSHKGLGFHVSYAPEMTAHSFGEWKASRVRVPARMIAVADATADGYYDVLVSPKTGPSTWPPGTVHRGGANVLFCDGHVEWYLQKDLIQPADSLSDEQMSRWQMIERMWNNDHLPHLES
jgi:prepilin-type processing-associated H-X9-DG protein